MPCRFLFGPQVIWPILGLGFRFLLPSFVLLQGIYLVHIVACNGEMYEAMQVCCLHAHDAVTGHQMY